MLIGNVSGLINLFSFNKNHYLQQFINCQQFPYDAKTITIIINNIKCVLDRRVRSVLRQEGGGSFQAMRAHVCVRELLADNEEVRAVPLSDRADGSDNRLQWGPRNYLRSEG